MEEYYIIFTFDDEEINCNLYHEQLFSKIEIEEILIAIYEECKIKEPKVFEQNMFKYYLDYKLRTTYGFVGYQRRNIYDYKDKTIFN